MIFIIESGSTKSDWVLVDDKSKQTFYKTIGFNPYFHSAELVSSEIKKNKEIIGHASSVKKIFFYGAGCSSEKMNNTIEKGIQSVFKDAEIFVEHDLLACAFATYEGEPGISCIIGTGSNSCHFDGVNLNEEVPALGYVLGDEGSASFIGKRLVSDFLYKRLPAEIAEDFYLTYQLDKDEIITSIYNKPNANVYLASFSRFAGKHMENPYVKMIVREGFAMFADIHIACFEACREVPIHFVGSVGAIFHELLADVLAERGMNLGQIIRKPVDGLIKYHVEYLKILDIYQAKS